MVKDQSHDETRRQDDFTSEVFFFLSSCLLNCIIHLPMNICGVELNWNMRQRIWLRPVSARGECEPHCTSFVYRRSVNKVEISNSHSRGCESEQKTPRTPPSKHFKKQACELENILLKAGTHISGDPVLQLLSLMLKLPRLSLLVTLSSRGPLCSRRDTEVLAFCSSWDRCSMLLYTCRATQSDQ